MKATIDHSIGAALQACASQTPARELQRPSTPPARSRNRDPGCDAARDGQGAPQINLTSRQLEVLALVCEGLSNKMICRRLNIAGGTVKVHISSLLRALNATSRLEVVVKALRLGLLPAARSRLEAVEKTHGLGTSGEPQGDHAGKGARVSALPATVRSGAPGYGACADA